jgi:hypothetical protein
MHSVFQHFGEMLKGLVSALPNWCRQDTGKSMDAVGVTKDREQVQLAATSESLQY